MVFYRSNPGCHLSWCFAPLNETMLHLHDDCCSEGGGNKAGWAQGRLCLNADKERTQLDPWESGSQGGRACASASFLPCSSGLCPVSVKNMYILDACPILTVLWVLWVLRWPSGALNVLPVSVGGWEERPFRSIVVTSQGTVRTWDGLCLKQGRGVVFLSSFSFLPLFLLIKSIGVCVCVCVICLCIYLLIFWEIFIWEMSTPQIVYSICPSPLALCPLTTAKQWIGLYTVFVSFCPIGLWAPWGQESHISNYIKRTQKTETCLQSLYYQHGNSQGSTCTKCWILTYYTPTYQLFLINMWVSHISEPQYTFTLCNFTVTSV